MNRNRIFCLICVLSAVFFLPGLVFAETVTVVGQAAMAGSQTQARALAIEDGLRAAVEQGVGTLIDSKTKVANFVVLDDRIYSQAKGYVTKYDILSEGKTPDQTMYTVTIRADVQTASIKNDLRAIGILRSQVGNPRFMALYLPETRVSAYRGSRVVRSAEQAINGVFARKGFVVLDRTFIDNVYDEIEQAGRIDVDLDDISKLALKYRADLLLVYDVQAARKTGGQSKYFGGVLVDMSLRAVAPATADLIAQKRGDQYARTAKGSGDYYEDMQASKVADSLGKAISESLIEDTLAYFERQVHAGARFDVWFRNFSEMQTYAIVDVIEAMTGFKDYNVRNQSPKNFQIDVNYQGKKFDFQRELFRGLKKEGISFQTQQAKGNRFLLFKKGTTNPFGDTNIY